MSEEEKGQHQNNQGRPQFPLSRHDEESAEPGDPQYAIQVEADDENENEPLLQSGLGPGPGPGNMELFQAQEKKVRTLQSALSNLVIEMALLRESQNTKIEALVRTFAAASDDRPPFPKPPGDLSKHLPEDTFSFILISKANTQPFLFAIFVYAFQITAFVLVTVDLVQGGDGPENPFNIPGNVSAQVRAAQLIAILISVCTQGDLLTGFGMLRDGYDTAIHQNVFPDSSRWQYVLQLVARLTEGSLGLVVSFLLIVTSDDVVELLLNFTAIEFVSNLDEVFFFLSKQGFMGKLCKQQAMQISQKSYTTKKKHSKAIKAILLFMILVGMLAGWAFVIDFQVTGQFLCKTVQVQFGDDFAPSLGAFSGIYDLKTTGYIPFALNRVEYVERRALELGNEVVAKFAYCSSLSAWAFLLETSKNPINDTCDEWKARSAPTTTYDFSETGTLPWTVRNSFGQEIHLNPFYLECFECKNEESCGGHGNCASSADNPFDRDICQCFKESRAFGYRCQFREPCEILAVDSLTDSFVSTRDWADRYERFVVNGVPIDAYSRPVYIEVIGSDQEQVMAYDIMIFLGRRWGLISSVSLPLQRDEKKSKDAIADYIRNKFHAYSDLPFAFLSEPSDFGTPSDTNSPVGLKWYKAKANQDTSQLGDHIPEKQIETQLLCQVCDDYNPCNFDGVCREGTCDCSPGARGALCEIPPVANGHCDAYFNTPEFRFDDGDCCEFACESSTEFRCGYDESGLVYEGYPLCNLPADKWHEHGEPIKGEAFSQSGSFTAVTDGGSVAIAESGGSGSVRLFDRDGSNLVERAASLRALEMTVQSLAVSAGPNPNLLSSDSFLPPLLVAVSGIETSSGNSTTHFFYCTISICEKQKSFPNGKRVALSQNGDMAAIIFDGYNEHVEIIQNSNWTVKEEVSLETILESFEDGWGMGEVEYYSYLYSMNGVSLGENIDGRLLLAVELRRVIFQGLIGYPFGNAFRVVTKMLKPQRNSVAEQRASGSEGDSFVYVDGRSFDIAHDASLDTELLRPSFALNKRGTVMVVAMSNCTFQSFALVRSGSVFSWTEQGNRMKLDMECKQSEDSMRSNSGQSIALSGNGRRAVIAKDGWDVKTFERNIGSEEEWVRAGGMLPGGTRASVALSSEGDFLAVGVPTSDANEAGTTQVYSRLMEASGPLKTLRISVIPDTLETSWTLVSNKTGEVVAEVEAFGSWGLAPYSMEMLVSSEDCHVLTLYPYKFVGSFSVSSGCSPPASLGDARLDLWLSNGWNVSSRMNESMANDIGAWCGHKTYAPRRFHVGNCSVGVCEEEAKPHLLEAVVYSVVGIQWELTEESGSVVLSGNRECSESAPCLDWSSACIDISSSCYRFTVTLEDNGLGGGRSLAIYLEPNPADVYVLLDGIKVEGAWKEEGGKLGACADGEDNIFSGGG